ncbi:MAG: hypothetical protein IJS47_02030 [Clostridia bacterium]|nr:hypothetical protein [Clostridia bacterium]
MKVFALKSDLFPRFHNFDHEYKGTKLVKVGEEDIIMYEDTLTDSFPYYFASNGDDLSKDAFIVRFYLSYDEEHYAEIIEILNKLNPLFHFLMADLVNVWEDTSITVEGIVDMKPHEFLKEFEKIMTSGR